MVEILIQFSVPLSFLAVTLLVGSTLERRHFASIRLREGRMRKLPTLTTREFPTDKTVTEVRLVTGSAVISVDYFKRFVAMLRMVFGGELVSYASLLDRARREAILRMQAEFPDADLIINLRLETSSVFKGEPKTIGCAEVLAYGTALKF